MSDIVPELPDRQVVILNTLREAYQRFKKPPRPQQESTSFNFNRTYPYIEGPRPAWRQQAVENQGNKEAILDNPINYRGSEKFKKYIPDMERIGMHGVVLVILASSLFGKPFPPPTAEQLVPKAGVLDDLTFVVSDPKVISFPLPEELVPPTSWYSKVANTPEVKALSPIDQFLKETYKYFSEDEKAEVEYQVKIRKLTEGLDKLGNPEKYKRIIERKAQIELAVEQFIPKDHPVNPEAWTAAILGIQSAELIEGKSDEFNPQGGTRGVGQFTEETALYLVKEFKIPSVDKNNIKQKLEDPNFSIQLQVKYFKKLVDNYGSFALAIFGYNAGMGTTNTFIDRYLRDKAFTLSKIDVDQAFKLTERIERAFKDPNNKYLKELIDEFKLTPGKLLGNPAVQNEIARSKKIKVSEEEWYKYYPRVIAGVGMIMLADSASKA